MRRDGRNQEEQEALDADPAQRPVHSGHLHRHIPHSGCDHIMVVILMVHMGPLNSPAVLAAKNWSINQIEQLTR